MPLRYIFGSRGASQLGGSLLGIPLGYSQPEVSYIHCLHLSFVKHIFEQILHPSIEPILEDQDIGPRNKDLVLLASAIKT